MNLETDYLEEESLREIEFQMPSFILKVVQKKSMGNQIV